MTGHDAQRTGRSSFIGPTTPPSGPSWTISTGAALIGDIAISTEGVIYFTSDKLYAANPDGTPYAPGVAITPLTSPAIDDVNGFVYVIAVSDSRNFDVLRYSKQLQDPVVVYHGPFSFVTPTSMTIGPDGTAYFSDGVSIIAVGPRSWRSQDRPCFGSPGFLAPTLGKDGSVYTMCNSGGGAGFGSGIYRYDGNTGVQTAFAGYSRGGTELTIDAQNDIRGGFQAFGGATFGGSYDTWDANLNQLTPPNQGDFTTSRSSLFSDGLSTVRIGFSFQSNGLIAEGAHAWGVPSGPQTLPNFSTVPTIDALDDVFVGTISGVASISGFDGSINWSLSVSDVITTQPVIDRNGLLFVGSQTGNIYSFKGQPAVETPTGLSAIAGEGSVYLRWDPTATPVDRYHIFVTGNDQAEIIYTPPVLSGLAGDQQITDVLITQLPNGTLLQNGRPYQFTVTAEIGNTQSPPSTTISVIPNGFVGHLPKPPINPILFVHGWNGSGTLKGTFAQTLDFMRGTLHWQFGGQIYHLQDSLANHVDQTGSCDLSNCKDDINVDPLGDFFTSSFGDKFANYGSGDSGLSHWADEVEEFVTQLKNDSVITPGTRLVIVAHSNGGLAARDFASLFNDAAHISDMITYGTPHQGADLFTVPGFSFGIDTGGGQDAEFTCTDKTIDLSQFLAELSVQSPPSDINYTAISGIISSPVSIKKFGVRVAKIPARRPLDCESAEWDGLVPKSSAQFADGPAETRRLFTNRFHTDEGSDFPAILCALNPACIQVQVLSPVDIQVIAPDGTQIARNTAEIAGASYDIINDSPQHQTTSVLIPFPSGGDYAIIPVPKPGVSPGDTFTITLSQNGSTTTVAHDVQIQNIPTTGYHINVNSFPIANAGINQTVECSGPNNALVTLDGTRSSDPDGDPLTFEWRDENGHLVGTTSTTTTPVGLGTHAFILTVRDNRGGFDSARVRISVQDTVPPALSVSLAPSILWPPNHTLMPVMASIQVHDSCDPAPAVKLISIISSEAPLISGAGQTVPDISGADFGTDDRSFMLRAERSGEGLGRTYTITYEAADHNGNKSTKSATVFVPHNK